MYLTPTSSATTSSSSSTDASSRIPTQTLDQQDFMNLLVTQLKSQDPLNPQQDTQFIAQMAQFSTLEQSKSMQSDMAQLRSDQQVTQANGLIGRTVEVQTGKDTTTQGIVSGVDMAAGTPKILVNGEEYGLDQLVAISQLAAQQ
jgi:flagellar basal-body rod modification protein FlgD